MELREYLKLISVKKQTIAVFVILALILTTIFVLIQPLKYGSESKVLVVQNIEGIADPYAMSKANEYLGSVLANIIESNLFYDDVIESGFNIDEDYFKQGGRDERIMKEWRKTVDARIINAAGIVEISVYHSDRHQLDQIARAINHNLKINHAKYHGLGESVSIKIIDKPISSSFPVKPNIIVSYSLALVMALLLSLSYIYLFPAEENELRLWPRKRKQTKIDLNQGMYNATDN